jgi:hypothetical protein
MPDNTHLPGGVFLSDTQEDTGAARRITGAMRAFGVGVWSDPGELQGGEAFMLLRKTTGALESGSPAGVRPDAAWSRLKDGPRVDETLKSPSRHE